MVNMIKRLIILLMVVLVIVLIYALYISFIIKYREQVFFGASILAMLCMAAGMIKYK